MDITATCTTCGFTIQNPSHTFVIEALLRHTDEAHVCRLIDIHGRVSAIFTVNPLQERPQ